jgi:hypothetical protein
VKTEISPDGKTAGFALGHIVTICRIGHNHHRLRGCRACAGIGSEITKDTFGLPALLTRRRADGADFMGIFKFDYYHRVIAGHALRTALTTQVNRRHTESARVIA